MAKFIELTNSYTHTPMLIAVYKIATVTANANTDSTNTILSVAGHETAVYVDEDYATVVRMIHENS
jgi:hypothetical protein